MLTNDVVDIQNHLINTNANGIWPITFISATQYSIAVAGNGVGGATGASQAVTMTSNVGLNPANGDAMNASTWIPGMSCSQDRTAFLALNLGGYKLVNLATYSLSLDTNTQWSLSGPSATATWTLIASSPVLPIWYIPGDYLDITFTSSAEAQPGIGVTLQNIGLVYSVQIPGDTASAYNEVVGSGVILSTLTNGGQPYTSCPQPVALSAPFIASIHGGASAATVWIGVGVYQLGATTGGVAFYGSRQMVVRQWRATGWPQ
jgi:hypothetical protein